MVKTQNFDTNKKLFNFEMIRTEYLFCFKQHSKTLHEINHRFKAAVSKGLSQNQYLKLNLVFK